MLTYASYSICDVVITVALCVRLNALDSSPLKRTREIVRRVSRLTIQANGLTLLVVVVRSAMYTVSLN